MKQREVTFNVWEEGDTKSFEILIYTQNKIYF